jgi:glutathione synthase/RimK-type ligase-like ATP-grasp enzyme
MAVIDDPLSILRCTNKIYLADLLKAQKVPAPRTLFLSRSRDKHLAAQVEELGFPVVLKIPDGSFSRGVEKAGDPEELERLAARLFHHSSVLLAQEYLFTDYDWRIGVLDRKPLYACRYYMSKGHWQIYKHGTSGQIAAGESETLLVQDAPPAVVSVALAAANLIGDGFYGVDVKQTGDQAMVVEVNDNPSIDAGYEDAALGKELYRLIMAELLRRMEARRSASERAGV